MTAFAPTADRRANLAMGIAVVGGAIVFLLASAALLNAGLAGRPMPDSLKSGAAVAHLASVMLALPLGISQLVLPKGTFRHRTVGYIWVALMVFTALASFGVHTINPHGLSWIHLFSVLTLILAPVIIFTARTGRVAQHQRSVIGLMIGGLAIAGLFTFIPGRALGNLVKAMFGQA